MAYRMPDSARIAIVGAGAMGSVFAARLMRAGADVTVLDVDEGLIAQISRDGVLLEGPDGEERAQPRAISAPTQLGPVDFVAFFVKCHATRAAARDLAPLVGSNTTIVSLQNGWGNGDVLADVFGPDRLIVGVTYISATVRGRGHVSYSGNGPTHVGAWSAAGETAASDFAALLRAGGLSAEPTPEVRTRIWEKLVLNAATLPTAALTGLTAGALNEHGQTAGLVRAAAAEAVAVARAAGLDLDERERCDTIAAVLERAGSGKGSMLQDVEAGRRTENDVISGAVLRMADAHGVDVPVTRALYALVNGLEYARGVV